jgi:hypothetical protein
MIDSVEQLEGKLLSYISYDVIAEHMKDRGFDPDDCILRDVLGSARKLVRKAVVETKESFRRGGNIVVEGPVEEPQLLYVVDAGSRTTLDRDIGFIQDLHQQFRMELMNNGIYSAKLDLDWTVEAYGRDSPVIAFVCELHPDEVSKLAGYLSDLCEVTYAERGFRVLKSLDNGWVIHDWMWRASDFDDELWGYPGFITDD